MTHPPRSLPVWLAYWPGRPGAYFRAKTAAGAAGQAVGAGQGEPAAVRMAGYSAYPERPRYRRPPPAAKPPTQTPGRKAEAALAIYGLLRVDWPIGSILDAPSAAHLHRASPAALRDFIANIGATLESLTTPHHLLDQVVADQARAWWYAANEYQARRVGEHDRAEMLAERKLFHRARARRLRKRKQYGQAAAELDGQLAGVTEYHQGVAEAFTAVVTGYGLSADDAATLLRRANRIIIPKL